MAQRHKLPGVYVLTRARRLYDGTFLRELQTETLLTGTFVTVLAEAPSERSTYLYWWVVTLNGTIGTVGWFGDNIDHNHAFSNVFKPPSKRVKQ